jgi:DNA-directed RNA polymerase specialized sigma24 family protein
LNHVRAQKRSPFSIGLPSSGSEKPRSQPDVERALHFQEVERRIFSQLSPEHQEVIDKVVLKGLTHTEAAAVLGIAEGTLKSRLMAAKRALLALAEPLLPPSQRGPL